MEDTADDVWAIRYGYAQSGAGDRRVCVQLIRKRIFTHVGVAGVDFAGNVPYVFQKHCQAAERKRSAYRYLPPACRCKDAPPFPVPKMRTESACAPRQGQNYDHLPQMWRKICKKELIGIAKARKSDIIKLYFR